MNIRSHNYQFFVNVKIGNWPRKYLVWKRTLCFWFCFSSYGYSYVSYSLTVLQLCDTFQNEDLFQHIRSKATCVS